MADSKISALPASTTPLAGTEVLPIVQSSTTKQVSVANLTAGRAINATAVTASTGNFVIGTAAKGINFTANTPAAGMTSQLLNWYEEGTFTPTIFGTTTAGAGTYSTQNGKYTRVGNLVTVSVYMVISAHTGTGNMKMGGLPFASHASTYSPVSLRINNVTMTAGNYMQVYTEAGTNNLNVEQVPVGGGALSSIPLDTNCEIMYSASYFI